ncbi:hypothetical protein AMJ40_00850 [candidate division TA06 bacterium DG_26]|uniref:Glycerol-3-phosphate acyltransferase n=1 Tax=candidate division TA06 bacterium DG_26 TaxID=1703771 RepID=A0A0S7WLT5_UNCT6|nr:MAG: hypothetical protein AMJ40_00850 [candidate division TA06 bacterium DG_26]
MILYPLSLLFGFLLGAIPTGYLISKGKGVDIRKYGSGNIGATNVARALGKKMGTLVLLTDVTKGFVPCYLASRYDLRYGILAGTGAVVGHTFTPFLKFKGGRGVATALGSVLGLMPVAGLLCVATWVLVVVLFRYISLASISGAIALPFWVYGVGRFSGAVSHVRLILALFISVLVVIRHVPNVRRLLRREEPKFHLRCR